MIQKLQTHRFLWKKAEDFTPEKIDKLVKKRHYRISFRGWCRKKHKKLHKNHNELLFLAERKKIGREEKLVPNLRDKKWYVVHIKKLNQALKHGLKLKKIHRVIEFEHSTWMKPCIMLNTKLRTAPINGFEKDFFKLMSNSVFGKKMKNIRNHKDMKLVVVI